MAAAVESKDVWRQKSPELVPIGGESEGDYNVFIRELIPSSKCLYEVLELLGRGTFGQVLKCWKKDTNEVVAVKILKNVPSYTKQGQIEVDVLSRLRKHGSEEFNFVLCLDSFVHRGHICIVFEMLHMNLYDYLKQGGFQPLPLRHIRPIAQQVLCCLVKLKELGLVHADLKPENIMLVDHGRQPFKVKVIDFGSASNRTTTNTTTYIQSRYYRAPEIILGLPYSESIDMWSLACVLVELYLGWPLFPGSSEYDQISFICQMLGPPPHQLCGNVSKTSKFFNKQFGQWTLKPQTQFHAETGIKPKETRKFVFTSVSAIAQAGSHGNSQLTEESVIEHFDRMQFVSMLESLLKFNPYERATPETCLQHPFITMNHLSMYSNCASVQELIGCMRVCCSPAPSPTYTPSHPLTYTPHPLTYHVSSHPVPHHQPEYGMMQLPPSWPLASMADCYQSMNFLGDHCGHQLANKLSHPPPYTHPYELYWLLPQYLLSNHR